VPVFFFFPYFFNKVSHHRRCAMTSQLASVHRHAILIVFVFWLTFGSQSICDGRNAESFVSADDGQHNNQTTMEDRKLKGK
jgi:hypothetical protein